ncbi:hypothetical protein [Escherichia coli]|nr:hypothetical protein [Escherichia coli]
MTKMTGLDAFYNESEDKIWFGNLIVTGSFKPSGLFPPALQK